MVVNGWFTCPRCRKNLQQVRGNTVMLGAPIYCRKCKMEWFPKIYMGRELEDISGKIES